MGTDAQERNRTPLPNLGVSKLQKGKDSLNDITNSIFEVAQSYDNEYTDLSHVLEDVADDVEAIKRHRMTKLTSLRDDIEGLLNAVGKAQKFATDTTMLERHREQVQYLERQKQQLVKNILTGKDEAQQLREKLNHVEQQMSFVREEHETVMDQTSIDLPSLEYLKRVLQRMSNTYLKKADSRVTEGFVCKNGTKDVCPFHFDESISHFDQVNHLWKMISEE